MRLGRLLEVDLENFVLEIEDIGYGNVALKPRRVKDWKFIVFQ